MKKIMICSFLLYSSSFFSRKSSANSIIIVLVLLFFSIKIDASPMQFYVDCVDREITVGSYQSSSFEKIAIVSFSMTDIEQLPRIVDAQKNEKILVYFHALWGGFGPYHKNTLHQFSQLKKYDKVVHVLWYVPHIGYKKNWYAAYENGKQYSSLFEQWLEEHPGQISVLCHSMGHRFFEGIVSQLHWSKISFDTIYFAAADLNTDVFTKNFILLPNHSDHVLVFIHQKDRLLQISKNLHHRDRLGLNGLLDLPFNKGIQVVDVTQLLGNTEGYRSLFGHIYFKKHTGILGVLDK